jgi:hypothetical protein
MTHQHLLVLLLLLHVSVLLLVVRYHHAVAVAGLLLQLLLVCCCRLHTALQVQSQHIWCHTSKPQLLLLQHSLVLLVHVCREL